MGGKGEHNNTADEKSCTVAEKTAAAVQLLPPQLALPGESYVAAADYFGTTAASQSARQARDYSAAAAAKSLKLVFVQFVQFGQKWHRWGP